MPDTAGFADDVLPEQLKLRHELILRIAHSESFRNAQMLQQLLLYLTEKADKGEVGALKEYSIGLEALGRKPDFDPKVDPIVRVQMHRLRQKLREYYANEGLGDPLVLEIAKGHYLPAFQAAEVVTTDKMATVEPDAYTVPLIGEQPLTAPVPGAATSRLGWRRGAIILIGIGGFVCGLLAALLWVQPHRMTTVLNNGSKPVQVFWSQFLGNDTAPIIGYPDAVFLLDESNDLFRFRKGATDQRGALVNPDVALQFASNPVLASKAGPLYYENGYTGMGELEGVAMLSSLFARMGVKPTIKSSRDITTEDLKQHNVILLGSPFQNTAVAQLPAMDDFVFENPDAHRELWRARILNLHPRANEDSKYQTLRDSATGVLKADYGLISVMRGVVPGLHIAILGGLDTTGTQGVTNFAVSSEGVTKMKDAMSSLKSGRISGFQVLLKVNLEKGYQVLDTQMMTLHETRRTSVGHADAGDAAATP